MTAACSRAAPATSERGFTLIEMLVALAILGLSLTVLFNVFSRALTRETHDKNEAEALALAQTLLAETMAKAPLATSRAQGTMPSGLRWRIVVAPYTPPSGENDVLRVARVDVAVGWNDQDPSRDVRLDSLSMMASTR